MTLEVVFFLIGCVAVVLIAYTVYINLELAVSDISKIGNKSAGPEQTTAKPEGGSGHTSGSPRFMIFYATWCPWSKKGKAQWEAFKKELVRFPVTFGGQSVTLEDIDGDVHRDMIRDYKITEYPTFKLVSKTGEVTMQGYPNPSKFREFLTKNLGTEEPAELVTRVS
jgi:thiol-disulfide isomerase/thioredoxin